MCPNELKAVIGEDYRQAKYTRFTDANVTLSPNTVILSAGYDPEEWMKSRRLHRTYHTVIGNNVWICTNVTVSPGAKILGHHIIIAPGAVVTGELSESYCLYAGIPARPVRKYGVRLDANEKERDS